MEHDNLLRRNARQAQESVSSAELSKATQTIQSLQASLGEATARVARAESQMIALREERASVAQELNAFEVDLRSQRAESKRFGIQLELLKSEQQASTSRSTAQRAQLENDSRMVKDRLRSTERELQSARADYTELQRWRDTHECEK